MSDASLTNIRMVKPKGPRIFLGVVALAAVGAAGWWLMKPSGPVGEPEDPQKILVVGKDADVASTLRELGFVTEHGTFEALAAEGAQAGAKGTGIAAILHLADLRGVGYVAIEDPASHADASLVVTGDSHAVKAEHRFAVFSVGDLGMPPKVTVDAEGSALPLPLYVELLRAAFGQNRLAGTLFAESQLPMEAVELYHAIKPAVELHGAYAVLDRRVAKDLRTRTETLVDAEQAASKPALLAGPLETTEVLALGDGTVLSFVHAWRLESPRDVEVTIQPSTEVELWFHPPGTVDPKARQRCGSLRSGTLALGSTHVVTSPQGDALLLESEAGVELWALDAKAGACAFTRKGAVPRATDEQFGRWGVPAASGRVLRPAMVADGMGVEVWTTGEDRPTPVPLPGCTQVGDPLWLDEGHFAIACAFVPPVPDQDDDYDDYDEELDADGDGVPDEVVPTEPEVAPPPPPPEQSWIYVVRIADAKAVAIPGTALGEHTGVYTLHAVPGATGLDLLAVHPWGGKLLRVRGSQGPTTLLAEAEVTYAMLADLDAKAAASAAAAAEALLAGKPPVVPAPTEAGAPVEAGAPTEAGAPAEVPAAPLLRPAFVPAGGMVAALAPARVTVSAIDVGGEFDGLALSPDGTRIVFTTDRGHEVRVLQLEGGTSTTIAKNPEARHMQPRFTADGKAVAFTSELDGNDRAEQVGRLATLGQ